MDRINFPIFQNIKELVYLDNAATTQKPNLVLDAINEFYTSYNSNIHRGLYPIAHKATDKYEEARNKVAKYINADPTEIIFTSGTTDSINMLVGMLEISGLLDSDSKILLSESEHHSNLLPWQRVKPKIDYLSLNSNFEYILDKDLTSYNFVAISHASNVTGYVFDLKELNNTKALKIIDASQSIGHMPIDVKKMQVDALFFSGHKMYGPLGIGVLYLNKELQERLQPYKRGGGIILEVTKDRTVWSNVPSKFEAGTPNIEGAIALGVAIDYINSIGFTKIQEHEKALNESLYTALKQIDNIKIFHARDVASLGVISFYIEGIHPHDIAQYLGDNNICVRAGHHCAQILHKDVFKVPASLRVSIGMYNDLKDIEKFIVKLREAVAIYKA